MKTVYFKLHLFRKAFVIWYINITFTWNDCAMVLPGVSHPNQAVSHRCTHCMKTLNGTTRVGTAIPQLQTFCSEALFSIVHLDHKRWKETIALLSLRWRFETNHVWVWLHMIWLESAGCLKSEKTKKPHNSSVLLYIWRFVAISLQVKINLATAGENSFYSRENFYSIKMIYYLKIQLMFSLVQSRREEKNLKHNFTDLSSFQILLFQWPNILPGNTLDNRYEKLCGWELSLMAFGPLNSLITKFIWNFILVLVTKEK